jgi:hypothetical protein
MMDHIISEGNRVYKNTSREHTWLIYYDHLKIWWEKESKCTMHYSKPSSLVAPHQLES